MKMTLPTDSEVRKGIPLLRGLVRYFPAALKGVAMISKAGNDKHNPGEELHHARGKSMDHGDCILRHLMDMQDLIAMYERGQGTWESNRLLDEANCLAWRALALAQELHERFGDAPLAPGAVLPLSQAVEQMYGGTIEDGITFGPLYTGPIKDFNKAFVGEASATSSPNQQPMEDIAAKSRNRLMKKAAARPLCRYGHVLPNGHVEGEDCPECKE